MSSNSPLAASNSAENENHSSQRRVMWKDLPNEIILDIVAGAAEFDFAMIQSLQLVDRRLYNILKAYERSLCRGYAANQLLRIIPCFPDIISPQCGACKFIEAPSNPTFHM